MKAFLKPDVPQNVLHSPVICVSWPGRKTPPGSSPFGAERGILGEFYLRFFTLKSACRLVQQAPLRVKGLVVTVCYERIKSCGCHARVQCRSHPGGDIWVIHLCVVVQVLPSQGRIGETNAVSKSKGPLRGSAQRSRPCVQDLTTNENSSCF